jgi:peptidoglycan/LPS O-acetylase OafA/YrhL
MSRLRELDILRGFASLNVVLYHFTTRYRQIYQHQYPRQFDWNYGFYGVQLFFVISGFVIFMTLHKVKDTRDFAFKRYKRLFPTYWTCVFITLSIIFLFDESSLAKISLLQIMANLTMIQGIFKVADIDGVYWSLLPELFFYVIMAFIYHFGWLYKIRVIGLIWLALMILNQAGILPFGAYLLDLKYGMFFLAGMLFYDLKFKQGHWTDHLLIFLCLITAIWVYQTPGCIYIFSWIFLIFYLFIYDKLRALSVQPLLFLGYISYPLYLVHQVIGFYLISFLKAYVVNELIVIMLTITIMLGLAWLVTKFIERPVLSRELMAIKYKLFVKNLRYMLLGSPLKHH